jgi:DNA-binding NarL/FixJ family response regulator
MKTIAICSHLTIIRSALVSFIESLGEYSVLIVADNSDEFIAKIDAAPALPDLCIFDIKMPVKNGYETIHNLKQKWPGIRTLVFTDINHPLALMLTLQYGTNGYIVTSAPTYLFKQVLDDICEGCYYFPPKLHEDLNRLLKKNKREKWGSLFTRREYTLITHCCRNLTCKEIAGEMDVNERTIESYFKNIFLKLNIRSRLELVELVQHIGLGRGMLVAGSA